MATRPPSSSSSSLLPSSPHAVIGTVGGKTVQQDAALFVGFAGYEHDTVKYGGVMVVADGHGDKGGHWAAKCTCEVLATELSRYPPDTSFTTKIIRRAFRKANMTILGSYPLFYPDIKAVPLHTVLEPGAILPSYTNKVADVAPTTSKKTRMHIPYVWQDTKTGELPDFGTTATVAIWQTRLRRLTTAHVGDTEVLVVVKANDNTKQIWRLCQPHQCTNKNERKRIRDLSKEVPVRLVRERSSTIRLFFQTNDRRQSIEPLRSLGHSIAAHFGISSIPQIDRMTLPRGNRLIFLMGATDGVWDMFNPLKGYKAVSDETVVSRLLQNGNGSARDMCILFMEWIKLHMKKSKHDNSTLCLFVDPQHAQSLSSSSSKIK